MARQEIFYKMEELVSLLDQLKEFNTVLTNEEKQNYVKLMQRLTNKFVILLPSGEVCSCCEGSGIEEGS